MIAVRITLEKAILVFPQIRDADRKPDANEHQDSRCNQGEGVYCHSMAVVVLAGSIFKATKIGDRLSAMAGARECPAPAARAESALAESYDAAVILRRANGVFRHSAT